MLRVALSTAAVGALAPGCAQGRTDTAGAPASGTPHPGGAGGGGPGSAHPASPGAAPPGAAPLRARPPTRVPGLPVEIGHGSRTGRQVALTFHGQGDPALATALLTRAEEAGAKVTVLAVGTWLEEQPAIARRILDGGHELGNHTMRHLDIGALPAREAYAEISRCADRLRALTGSIGSWFRPSRTQHATGLVTRLAREAGYPHVLSYDVDSLDAEDPGPAAVRRTVLDRIRPGSVVSLHFGHAGTLAALPPILDGLHRRGLRAVTTTELVT
ncbi:polysaccharide deacetylase family protein [Streptomyces sp. MST-110588]|uniref:polysaccharide deacetylase family protein n=1 Tax=Streptomyces sp. MST-110588 TaxID=2833628 RepID=UPI001F5CAEFA|nr:polysaccharide deacetylase family protein [Streptomyces sp. MST-110588]UNO39024.1 polysaccharide deacetylase family protein [Streptomyces sp. MST-110588]